MAPSGRLGSPHLERLVYVCECQRGKGPHIHWDAFQNEPQHLDFLEPLPTGEYVIVPKKEPK